MRLTVDILHQIMPIAPRARLAKYLPYIEAAAIAYDIRTEKRFAAWIANLAEESSELRYMEEIASGAEYDTRTDLGNTAARDGDGAFFKGHGPIQITGRTNHQAYRDYVKAANHLPYVDFLKEPARIAQLPYSMDSAGWFWAVYKKLNQKADRGEFLACCIGVNGRNKKTGLPNGWGTRKTYYERALRVLPDNFYLTGEDDVPTPTIHTEEVVEHDGYPDYIENPVSTTPEVPEVGEGDKKGSEGQETPGIDPSQVTYLTKEKPSTFVRWITGIKIAIGSFVTMVSGWFGSSEISNQVASKAIDSADASLFQKLLPVVIITAIGIGAGVLLIWIASIFYDKAARRAAEINVKKIDQPGTIELTDKSIPTAPIDTAVVQVQADTAQVNAEQIQGG